VGGAAPCLLEPEDPEALAELIGFLEEEGLPLRIIGAGSNILAADGGIADILVGTRRIDSIEVIEENVPDARTALVRLGAGVPLHRLSAFCCERGLGGAECLAGIPGTVGGAVVMNAGGRHGDVASIVETVTVVSHHSTLSEPRVAPREPCEVLRELPAEECAFVYRNSALRNMVVAGAVFRLFRDDAGSVRERTADVLSEKRKSQPLGARSCGCVFKNPPGLHAGKLLDEAGLKGIEQGGARVSEKHAAFFVNGGNATCVDFERLIVRVRDEIRRLHGLELELEVDVWN
jgi:UDP-N-acetylmuramate dehydrogenase